MPSREWIGGSEAAEARNPDYARRSVATRRAFTSHIVGYPTHHLTTFLAHQFHQAEAYGAEGCSSGRGRPPATKTLATGHERRASLAQDQKVGGPRRERPADRVAACPVRQTALVSGRHPDRIRAKR
jgi:hypothetical protein